MSDATTRRWATGIAIGSLAVLVVTSLLVYWSASRLSEPAYATGQPIDLPASLYQGASHTLVVVARSSCGGCQAAKPFLGELVAGMRRVAGSRVALVVERSDAVEQAFAREIGIAPGEVVPLDVQRFNVRRVPTVLVVDGAGTIRFSHENAPVAAEQAALLAKYREALRRP